jgi:hypothetical protein
MASKFPHISVPNISNPNGVLGTEGFESLKTGNGDHSSLHDYFDRYRISDSNSDIAQTTGIGFVFLVKPDLNLVPIQGGTNYLKLLNPAATALSFLSEAAGEAALNQEPALQGSFEEKDGYTAEKSTMYNVRTNPFFRFMCAAKPELVAQLTKNPKYDSPFANIFTNKVKAFSPKDNVLETTDAFETFVGAKMNLPRNAIASRQPDSFTLEMDETSSLDLTLMIKLWVDYTENVTRGYCLPSERSLRSNAIDYMGSLYYFLLDWDCSRIMYWAKYSGIYPTAVPYSAYSLAPGSSEVIKLSVPFQYQWKEDMDPEILSEFNYVANLMNPPQGIIGNTLDYFTKAVERAPVVVLGNAADSVIKKTASKVKDAVISRTLGDNGREFFGQEASDIGETMSQANTASDLDLSSYGGPAGRHYKHVRILTKSDRDASGAVNDVSFHLQFFTDFSDTEKETIRRNGADIFQFSPINDSGIQLTDPAPINSSVTPSAR